MTAVIAAMAIAFALAATLARTLDSSRMIRFAELRSGRPIRVAGGLSVRLLSLHPRVVAKRVVIGNPQWMPAGQMAQIGQLTLDLRWHWLPLYGEIRRLEIQDASLYLQRDDAGRSNWQWSPPGQDDGPGAPLIHSLFMPRAHVLLADKRRHLEFAGTVSAQDAKVAAGPSPLRIEAAGVLNGRAVNLAVNGDPLASASTTRPYQFAFAERAATAHLTGRGALRSAFDFRFLRATFESSGDNLKDLYVLAGVSLPNTGPYQLSGTAIRNGATVQFEGLAARSGQSDLRGRLTIESAADRSQLHGELFADRVRTADIGERAAGLAPRSPDADKRLLSDAAVQFTEMSRSDASIGFHAERFEVGRSMLHKLAATVSIDHGVLTANPVSAVFNEGQILGRIRIDATHAVPLSEADFKVSGVRLGLFSRKDPAAPPVDGALQAHFALEGQGNSIRQFAATASGKVTAAMAHGEVRTALAELAGVDLLRGLGLLADKGDMTTVRCAVAGFDVHDGEMATQSIVVDTDPVVITGSGQIHLDSESVDLLLRGRPKKMRLLRIHSPVWVQGTLLHPTVGLGSKRGVVAQAGAAVALGVALTPVAALLAFVDPGLAQNTDCAGLLAAARGDGVPTGRRD